MGSPGGYRWYGPGILKLFDLAPNKSLTLDQLFRRLQPSLFDRDTIKRCLDQLIANDVLSIEGDVFTSRYPNFGEALNRYRPPSRSAYLSGLLTAGHEIMSGVPARYRSIDSTILALDDEHLEILRSSVAKRMAGFAAEPGTSVSYLNMELFPLTRSGPPDSVSDHLVPANNWMHAAFRELILLPDFQPTAAWAKERLFFRVDQQAVSATMEHLVDTGNIVFNERSKSYSQSTPNVTTGSLVSGDAVVEYHKTVLKMTDLAGALLPTKELRLNSQILALSTNGIESVIQDINQFISELLDQTSNVQKPRHVYQFNLQFFPITKTDEEGI